MLYYGYYASRPLWQFCFRSSLGLAGGFAIQANAFPLAPATLYWGSNDSAMRISVYAGRVARRGAVLTGHSFVLLGSSDLASQSHQALWSYSPHGGIV